MFCTNCGTASASDDSFCTKCGNALQLSDPPQMLSSSKLVPLIRYPFLRQREGETSHATRYCNVVVERQFAGEMHINIFPKRIQGTFEPPRHVKFNIPVLLMTNRRLVFLQSDASLMYWRIMLHRRDTFLEALNRGLEQQTSRHGARRRGIRGNIVPMYLSPYWVLDPSLNDELDKEYKDVVCPRHSDINNLSTLLRESEESPYKFEEASSGWTWVRSVSRTKEDRLLRSPRECLEFQLGRVKAKPRAHSVLEIVPENASGFSKGVAKVFDKLQARSEISSGELEGGARLYLATPDQLDDFATMLQNVPTSETAFTQQYQAALVDEIETFAANVKAGAFQPGQSEKTGSGDNPRPSPAESVAKVYSAMGEHALRSWTKIFKTLAIPVFALLLLGSIGSTSGVLRRAFPAIPVFFALSLPVAVTVASWIYFRKRTAFARLGLSLLALFGFYFVCSLLLGKH
jgi:hypothetical protein